jgi:uncharacterized membrane protein YhhN
MLKSKWLVLYFVTLLADILFIALDMSVYRYATKPLLTLILAVYLLDAGVKMPGASLPLLLLALFFSFGGDVLLLFDKFFLPGLGSFLLAHIMYIVFFLKIRYSNYYIPLCKYPLVFLNVAVLIVFILFLLPYLGSLAIPVIIYTIIIFIMVQSVLHAFNFNWQPAGWYCIIGAVLFMISDALIAIGKFYHSFPYGGVLVMLTYGIAQWGLVYGSIQYYRRM